MKVDYSNSIEMSTVDWSEHVSHTIFLNGCNLRCPYCYNGELVNRSNRIDLQLLYDEISAAAKYVDSVVFSG
jgi:pyruvate formate lyase activating enzyme